MSCPYYIDFTRDCLQTYPAIIQYKDFSSCESEDRYLKCLVYQILQADFRCKYLKECLNMFPEDIPEFFKLLNYNEKIYDFVTKPTYQYCLSKDTYQDCARYKIKESGGEPPPGLTPSGQSVDIRDSIREKNIVFDSSP